MTANTPLTLTVSIVVYDSELSELALLLNSLRSSLETLAASGLRVQTRISLIDNSDAQRLRPADIVRLQERTNLEPAELELLTGHGNVGFGSGHNLAIRTSKSRYHLVLNPDVELASDSLAVGLNYLEQHPDVALISPYAESGDGEQQYLCKRHPTLLVLFVRGFLPRIVRPLFKRYLAHYEMRDLAANSTGADVPLASGCFMLCRTDQLQAIGGFDEAYFLYFEDFDLSLRLGKIARLVYLPDMKIRHGGGNAAAKGLKHIRLYSRSAWRFFNTWGWRFIQ